LSAINGELGGKFASARDSGTIDIVVPFNTDGNSVELLATLENIPVNVEHPRQSGLKRTYGDRRDG